MSVVVTSWNTGLIVGPAIGGKLFKHTLCSNSWSLLRGLWNMFYLVRWEGLSVEMNSERFLYHSLFIA